MEPSTTVKLEGEDAEKMLRLADALDDLDDVQGVYANFDISEEEMARLADGGPPAAGDPDRAGEARCASSGSIPART